MRGREGPNDKWARQERRRPTHTWRTRSVEGDVTTKFRITLNTILICAALATAPGQARGPVVRSVDSSGKRSSSDQTKLASLLREPLPGRATAQGSATIYNPDSLYQYIDGGADLYLLYDFKALLHQDFKNGSTEFTADIYEMSKPEDAFGIYASERSSGYKFIPIGAEGYRDKGILNFFADHYYVKLSGSGANVDALLDQFARLLSSRIGGTRTLPSLLANLPREHRILHSEQYMKRDPLGHAFLAPAYAVSYRLGNRESKLIVSVAADPQAAKARADQLAKHFKQSGESASAPEFGEGGIRAKNSFEGEVIARTHGRYLIALFNPAGNGAAVLKATAQSLSQM